jgi:hypothetical protein
VTLGRNAGIQFDKLLEGIDVGIRPLSRIINGLGYDLCLVPVKSDNFELLNSIQSQWDTVSKNMKNDLINFINDSFKSGRKLRKDSLEAKLDSEYVNNMLDDFLEN